MSMKPKTITDIVPLLEQLPQRTAQQLMQEWTETVREVRELGTIAVTERGQVEMVMMDAETYWNISAFAAEVRPATEASLAELSADFDRRLASFKTEGIRNKVSDVLSQRGHIKHQPKAGPTY